MAELHVQRKRRSSWLLWLILILILAAALYYLYVNYYQGVNTITSVYPTAGFFFRA
ncbi:MAG: hypothetical protein H7Y13_16455 [Sphingobacteriaceae bacterium]|nr:hypothetical protein [Sphingobacteriaceae bacterium]